MGGLGVLVWVWVYGCVLCERGGEGREGGREGEREREREMRMY